MSHFSKIATKLTNKEYLLTALKQLGYEVEEDTVLQGYRQQKIKVGIAACTSAGYGIGFNAGEGGYEIVADWFGVQGTNEQEFTAKVQQQYALVTVMDQVGRQGFNIVEQQRDADGKLRIVARRWV